MFKPHVTVACVVHAEGKFLVVEETINGKALWNQPAGHLEADETLVEAAARELWEETASQPQHFICMHQWIARIKTPFLRFLLPLSLSKYARPSLRQRYRLLPLSCRRNFTGVKSGPPLVAESIRLLSKGNAIRWR